MNSKEKAKELVDRYYQLLPLEQNVITTHGELTEVYSGWNNAKQCALVAVDEIINFLEEMCESKSYDPFEAPLFELDYYKEVKQNIN